MFLTSILSCISLPGHYKTCEYSNETPKSGGIHSLLGFEVLGGHLTLDSLGCVMVIMNNILILFIGNFLELITKGVVLVPKFPFPSSYRTQFASIGGQPPVVVCGPLMMWNLSAGMISPPNFNLGPPFFLRKVDPDERIHAKNCCFFHNQESRPKVRIPKVRLRN